MIERQPFTLVSEGIEIKGETLIPLHLSVKKLPAVCLCHGIPAGIRPAGDSGYLPLAEKLCLGGFVTVLFNFRGTGISGGDFDMTGWANDLTNVLNYLCQLQLVDIEQVALMSFSGGAAVSVHNSGNRDSRIKYLILCACPAEFRFLGGDNDIEVLIENFRERGIIRNPSFPASPLEWYSGFQKVTPINWIDKIAAKAVLFLHGEQDELIPVSEAWRLYNKATCQKDIMIIGEAGHKLRLNDRAMNMAINWLKYQIQVDHKL